MSRSDQEKRDRSSPPLSSDPTPPGQRGSFGNTGSIAGLSRFEVILTLDKEKVREKEGVHIAFPFGVPEGTVRIDVGSGSVRPEADQIAGACRDFFCARDSVDISNNDFGVTWTPLDAPLVEIGAITDETPGAGERRSWLKSLAPSNLLFSYAMNNYWHTNYKADQEGPVTLRYAVEPHRGSDTATAKKLGAEAMTPLVPVAADSASPVPRFPLGVEPASFVATSLRAVGGRQSLDPSAPERLGPRRNASALGRCLRPGPRLPQRPRRSGGCPRRRPHRSPRLRHPDPAGPQIRGHALKGLYRAL